MINVSTAFKQKLYNDEREYENTLTFTLTDGTVLTVTHEHIMGGGIELDDSVGEDSAFTALGSTICNSLTVTLYNNDEIYSDYVFENAKCVYTVGLPVPYGTSIITETIKKGTFTVDSATYNDYAITLTMLDNMEQFDRPYDSSTLVYPATLNDIVLDACSRCGVSLDNSSLNFPHKTFSVAEKPLDKSTTYREVLGWCATIAGCFARCNPDGKLELKWFDTASLENTSNSYDGGVFDNGTPSYTTGDSADGGSFNPWNDGTTIGNEEFTTPIPMHYITDLYSQSIGVDDTVITGVSISMKASSADAQQDISAYSQGTSDFMIEISDNPFITESTVSTVLGWLSTQLIGLRFRQCNVTHPSDPSIEAGDIALFWDKKGDEHPILITRATFSPSSSQTIICGAETPSKNQSSRVSESTKVFIESRKQLKEQKNAYDAALEELAESIDNSNGLYKTEVVQQDQSVKIYYHNKPLLAESDIQMLFSTTGFTVTANGTAQNPTWYGLTVDGTLISAIMNTIGINFDWGTGGTLTLGGANNGNGVLRVLDEDDRYCGGLDNSGLKITGQITLQAGSVAGNTYSYLGYIPTFWGQGVNFYDRYSTNFNFWPKSNTGDKKGFGVSQYNGNKLISGHAFPVSSLTEPETIQEHHFSIGGYYCRGIEFAPGESDLNNLSSYSNDYNYLCSVAETVEVQSGINSSTGMYVGGRAIVWTLKGVVGSNATGGYNTGNGEFKLQCDTYATTIRFNNVALAFQSSSSKRYKNNIRGLTDNSLDPHKLLELKPKQFKYKKDFEQLQYQDMKDKLLPGFIAEEVAEIYPSAVIHNDEGEIESWDERRLIPGMLSLIQEQHEKIETLEARVEQLESLISKLIDERK